MDTRSLLVALVTLSSAALAEDRPAPPIEARLRFDDDAREWRGPPGKLPPLRLVVANTTRAAVELEGPLEGNDWSLGLGGWLKVTGPDGVERTFRPSVADCNGGRVRPLAPGEERREGLWLERWFAIPTPGRYQVQVGLRTRAGDEVASAPLAFEVTALEPSAPGVSVELLGLERNEHGGEVARLRFRNAGPEEVTILRPQDGSEWGWLEPHYWFEITDAEGRLVPLPSRCGNHGADYASDAHYLRIPAGAAKELEVSVPHDLAGGKHTVRFHYVQTARPGQAEIQVPGEGKAGGKVSPLAGKLFLGQLTSGTLEVERPGPSIAALCATGTPGQIAARLLTALGEVEEDERHRVITALQRLVGLRCLGPKDEALIRGTFLAARKQGAPDPSGQVHQLLLDLADPSCAEAFHMTIVAARPQEGSARYHAAVGLRRLAPRAAVESLMVELQARRVPDERLEAISEALGVITGLPHDEGPGPVTYPREPGALEAARRRWLEWWKGDGSTWTQPAGLCPSCKEPRNGVTPCPGCGAS